MKKYSSYKDSGVEWIGKIPSHWIFGPMKYELCNNDGGVWGKDVEDEDDGTFVIRSTEITIDGNWDLSNPMKRLLNNKEIEKSRLVKGDIVITKSSGSPDHIGKSVIVSKEIENLICCYSNFVQRIRFKNYSPKLYHYILNSYVVREQYRYLTQSTTGLGNLSGSTLNEVLLPYIPLPEQQQIVSFLDDKTKKIDSLIQHKEKKIELLKEKRTSLINHVVTKGLDPNVEMKDSGVEWIGEIPSYWEIKQLKHLIENLNSGKSVNSEDSPVKETTKLGVLKTSCVYGNIFRPEENKMVVLEEYDRVKCPVVKNSIIISRMNTPQYVGSNGYVDKDYPNLFLPDRLWITEFFEDIELSVRWLSYIFKSNKFGSEISSRSTGTSPSMKNITKGDLLTMKIPFPSFEKQKQISVYLDEQTKEIKTLIQLEKNKIELLKEYRQSLISEVVTGKIRVCEEDYSLNLESQKV